MPFAWHGRNNRPDGIVWEQNITRYYFICNEEIKMKRQYGEEQVIKKGTRLKLTKSEAHRFFSKGYVKYNTYAWNGSHNERLDVYLHDGIVHKDIEIRVCTESEVRPDEVKPKRKKK